MKYPQLFVVPVLMMIDYWLTVASAFLKDKGYSAHVKTEHYELNPLLREAVARKQWISSRHLFGATAVTLLLIGLTEVLNVAPALAEAVLGLCIVLFGMLIGRHVSNLAIFAFAARHPEQITGQVEFAHTMVLWLSLFQYSVAFVPLLIVVIFAPSPFVVGGTVACVVLTLAHLNWVRLHRKHQAMAAKQPQS